MTFLRNAWYCAAWSREVADKPLGRTLLEEKVVLYRKQDGGLVAIGDVCPHRFAPLHAGPVTGDAIACRYHGLQFGPDGACVHNPHDTRISPAMRVKAYPLVERYGVAWIWMGDAALADDALIPDFSVHVDPGFRTVEGLIYVKGSYQLVCDNLLDLSHTQYLHPLLIQSGGETSHGLEQEGETVLQTVKGRNSKLGGFQQFLWPDGPERIDSHGGLRWDAPGNMLLTINSTAVGGRPGEGILAYGLELATPETETTCHYFWSFDRNFRRDEEGLDEALRAGVSSVFENEDAWIIGEVQANMGEATDLLALKPVILPSDACAIRARLITADKLKRERIALAAE
jgi:vanillate O-demethylase monooxygenase subunit